MNISICRKKGVGQMRHGARPLAYTRRHGGLCARPDIAEGLGLGEFNRGLGRFEKRREPHQAILSHAGMAAADRHGGDIPPVVPTANQRRDQVLADLYGWIHENLSMPAKEAGHPMKTMGRKARAVELDPQPACRGIRCRRGTASDKTREDQGWLARKKHRAIARFSWNHSARRDNF
ncbi:MAG: hypothetical protein WA909_08645 [Castellaniella sp.]|uniref:hypothetical protein n=1 Tax=Castellaniella sp. TaxID=1955812 RepID=UPI003C765BEB